MELIIPVESTKPFEASKHFAAGQMKRWFEACDQFLKWERANMLLTARSNELSEQHRRALYLLLRFIRGTCEDAQAADVDEETKSALEGCLQKLQASWNTFYEPIRETESKYIRQGPVSGKR